MSSIASQFLNYISENNSLFRRQKPIEDGFPADFGYWYHLWIHAIQVLFKSSIEAEQKGKQWTRSHLHPNAAGQVICLPLFLQAASSPLGNTQTRFLGLMLGLLPWCYTYKEIRAGRQQEEAAAWRTQRTCSANLAKVTILKQKGRNVETPTHFH